MQRLWSILTHMSYYKIKDKIVDLIMFSWNQVVKALLLTSLRVFSCGCSEERMGKVIIKSVLHYDFSSKGFVTGLPLSMQESTPLREFECFSNYAFAQSSLSGTWLCQSVLSEELLYFSTKRFSNTLTCE